MGHLARGGPIFRYEDYFQGAGLVGIETFFSENWEDAIEFKHSTKWLPKKLLNAFPIEIWEN